MAAMQQAVRDLGLWLQLAVDVGAACLTDGPAGAGEASRVARLRRRQSRPGLRPACGRGEVGARSRIATPT